MKLIYPSLLVAFCVTCATPMKPVTPRCPTERPLLETITINAGLAPGIVPFATPRTAPFAKQMEKLRGVGLICLQEVWKPEARELVLKHLDLPEENVLYEDTGGEGESPGEYVCTKKQLKPVLRCAQTKCANTADEDAAICILNKCRMDLYRLSKRSEKCLHCLISQAGNTAEEAYGTCTSSEGARMVYGGQNGVILASRWPLHDKEVIRLPSSAANRVALFATVRIDGFEPIEVACTHLSTETHLDPFLPQFKDWEDEMMAQAKMISEHLKRRAGDRPQIFIGDMNAGPARGSMGYLYLPDMPLLHRNTQIISQSSRVWRYLMGDGFDSAAARSEPAFCSTCNGNSLRTSRTNYIIDHVLVRDPKGGTELSPVCTYPYLNEEYYIRGYKGELMRSHLADHYGVVVKYDLKNVPRNSAE